MYLEEGMLTTVDCLQLPLLLSSASRGLCSTDSVLYPILSYDRTPILHVPPLTTLYHPINVYLDEGMLTVDC